MGVFLAVRKGITDEHWVLIGSAKAMALILKWARGLPERHVSIAYRKVDDYFLLSVCRGSGDCVAMYN